MAFFILVSVALLVIQDDTLERARFLADSGKTSEAVKLLESRTRVEPRAPELAYLAQLQAASGGLPQAAATLKLALELAPEQDSLRVTRGAILFELRRFEEAKGGLELAVARRAGDARAHYYLAAVYRGLLRLDLAEAMARRAVELSPPPAPAPLESREPLPAVAARELLAEIRFARGEDVESAVREVLAAEPDHASARYLLGRSLQRSGRVEEAADELRRFDRIQSAGGHLALARDLSSLGRREKAIEELERALAANPDDVRASFLLGRELLRAGRKDEAGPVLESVLARRPDAASEVARLRDSFP
jgi:tetratricopeptide (TPR) repeat protein